MYHPVQLASFALMQFEHGLQGLTEEEAQVRLNKADGSQMNSISWIVGHISWQWIRLAVRVAMARGLKEGPDDPYPALRARVRQFRSGGGEPTPPTLQEAISLLHEARELSKWLIGVDDAVMSAVQWGTDSRDGGVVRGGDEKLGTSVIRNTFHTWFHTGEVNAIRQMLGHPEIIFILMMAGNMEWSPAENGEPEWVPYPPVVTPADAALMTQVHQVLPAGS